MTWVLWTWDDMILPFTAFFPLYPGLASSLCDIIPVSMVESQDMQVLQILYSVETPYYGLETCIMVFGFYSLKLPGA